MTFLGMVWRKVLDAKALSLKLEWYSWSQRKVTENLGSSIPICGVALWTYKNADVTPDGKGYAYSRDAIHAGLNAFAIFPATMSGSLKE